MDAYHHSSKAGNFADVHKHWLLSLLLTQPRRKSVSLTYVDTHAGSGIYTLNTSPEAAEGIACLWSDKGPHPEGIQNYLRAVRSHNHSNPLNHYPGSPLLAQFFLQPQDRGEFFDNQPGVIRELRQALRRDERFTQTCGNGFQGIADISGQTDSAVLLIDPPYEREHEFGQVAEILRGLCQQTTPWQIAVWYPIFSAESGMPRLTGGNIWISELLPHNRKGKRMCGSGMMLLNAPDALIAQAEQEGEYLAQQLQARMRYWRPS